MKALFSLLLILSISFSASLVQAQDQNVAQVELSGFGGPMIQVTGFDEETAVMVGAGAALLVSQRFYIGGYGMVMASPIERTLEFAGQPDQDLTIGFNQFGIWLGYIVNPDNKVQATVNSHIGFGSLNPQELDQNDRVYMISPHAGVQYAASDWLRIELNTGYRVMGNVNSSQVISQLFSNQSLSAPFGGLTLRFGGFRQ